MCSEEKTRKLTLPDLSFDPEPEKPQKLPSLKNEMQIAADISKKFTKNEHGITAGDIKVLWSRAGKLRWPNGEKFSSKDRKEMVRYLFQIERSRELNKSQFDFLYMEFGRVLSGEAQLDYNEKGYPTIVNKSSSNF